MKTQTISQNTHLFLQTHPQEANTCRESFEILQVYLQRTVNLLGQRLFDLTQNQADLSEIGKAQRALAGAIRDFHKTLGFLSDIQDIEPEVLHHPIPNETTVYHPPEPVPGQQPQPAPQPAPQPQPDPSPLENSEPQPDPTPPAPPFKPVDPVDPVDPANEDPEETLPPLDPFADNFEEIATLYETKLKAAIAELQNPESTAQEAPESPQPAEPSTRPAKIGPPKKYNTRRKRKDQKYLRKLQKRQAAKAA